MNLRISALLLLLLSFGLSGCILSRSTTYADVERVRVSFASERAGRLFYETLQRLPQRQRDVSTNQVILILVNVERKTVTGPNRFFNEAVQRCDTNRDGIISEEEAAIFSASVKSDSGIVIKETA